MLLSQVSLVMITLMMLLSQVSLGNISNVLKELGKLPNPDDGKKKGSPKKEKEKEPDARKDSPKKKTDEVTFSYFFGFYYKSAIYMYNVSRPVNEHVRVCSGCPSFARMHVRRCLHCSSIALSMIVWSVPCLTCREHCFSSQCLFR